MALRATLEPRLMSAMAMPKPRDTMTALRGMFHPGLTCSRLADGLGKFLQAIEGSFRG